MNIIFRNKFDDEGSDDLSSRVSDYTYEEFVQEFQAEVAPEAVFEEDARIEAEHEVLDGGTYQVGRVPDKQYLTVIITFGRDICLLKRYSPSSKLRCQMKI